MSEITLWDRALAWCAYLPIRLAYRIVWAAARMNLEDARDVYRAMWLANLDLPPIAGLTTPPSEPKL